MSSTKIRICKKNGILFLDKPQGISSNDAIKKIKSIYNAKKTGHTGTLDPLATGMLPVCINEATKIAKYLLYSDKRYHLIAKLGNSTDTSDSEGMVIKKPINFHGSHIKMNLEKFIGKIKLVPPRFSALKYQGKNMYEYARKGVDVSRKERNITVYHLKLLHLEKEKLELEIHCSKGTYIRTITENIGELLGCGAHVIYLRRIQVAQYPVTNMVNFEKLTELVEQEKKENIHSGKLINKLLIPIECILYNVK